jgi:hypothetical protein
MNTENTSSFLLEPTTGRQQAAAEVDENKKYSG